MVFINAGIKLRTNNMALAKNNTQLLRGLSQLEAEQAKELGLANKLSGDVAKDVPTLQQLQIAFQRGIAQNRNLQGQVS